jgi:hypothetical protein|tara:strand:- start:611 stop:799 length:189 start_codon:yes stop_codon:yes gene_type:complete
MPFFEKHGEALVIGSSRLPRLIHGILSFHFTAVRFSFMCDHHRQDKLEFFWSSYLSGNGFLK